MGLLPIDCPFTDESVTVVESTGSKQEPGARDTAGLSPALILLLALLLQSYVTCDKCLDLSAPQFLCLSNRRMVPSWSDCKNQRSSVCVKVCG